MALGQLVLEVLGEQQGIFHLAKQAARSGPYPYQHGPLLDLRPLSQNQNWERG